MTRNHARLVGQRQQSIVQRPKDLPSVAARQIGSADRPGKQRIAGQQQIFRRKMQADAALRVSWRVQESEPCGP